MSNAKRAPLKYSVRMDQKTSWGMQGKFVCETDAAAFAGYLAHRLRHAGELVVGIFFQNELRFRVDAKGRKYRVVGGKIDLKEHTDGISAITPIPAEVTQEPITDQITPADTQRLL